MFNRNLVFKITVFLVLTCFAGCVTSRNEYVDIDKLPKKKVYHITQAYLKDGKVIDLKDKEPVVKLYHKGIKNVVVYYENGNIERNLLLSDVSKFKIEIVESNTTLNVIIIVSAVLVLFLALILIYGDSVDLDPH